MKLGRKLTFLAVCALALAGAVSWTTHAMGAGDSEATGALEKVGIQKGVCAVLGLPRDSRADSVIELAKGSDLLVYFQSPQADEVAPVRKAAEAAGLLGSRVFVDQGQWNSIHLASNLAGAILVGPGASDAVPREEILRVLHPEGKAVVGETEIIKPLPEGIDDWSHPYHGPDNNPQSTDQLARAPYMTQFLADPLFVPMPQISVASAGRVFRAFGHIAHKANQNAMLNTLICASGYNGTLLWKRPLKEGFMIHRNTMIATPDTLYMADDESCKLIDTRTGQVRDEIVIPEGLADGRVWKWMALQDGILFALIGGEEVQPATQPSTVRGLGHWPWGMWEGHDYKDPKTSFGFGRTFVAIDASTKGILWSHRAEEYIDSRGVCMKGSRIYYYSPMLLLGCLDAKAGKVVWKNDDHDLLTAVGPNGPAQHYVTGYATTTYIKCNDECIFFAGPQRNRLVVASTEDGSLLWQKEQGNLQLVLRDDAVYAAGPQESGCRLAYATGDLLSRLPTRRACTRATGTIDSIFYRTSGGTVRVATASNKAHHIAPMRPPCQDGVLISDGMLYWGPWMCGCQLSLYGHICLSAAGEFNLRPLADGPQLEKDLTAKASVEPLEVAPGDWPTYGGDNARSMASRVALPNSIEQLWTLQTRAGGRPSAPVTAGGLVFVGHESGAVLALDAGSGQVRWQAHTGGAVYFPPAVADGRVYVGSADGRVYAFEATTGRPLWRFRAAPAERWIPVYGKLISTWPVAGGVVVEDGVVYAAAGIAHYDGTYVYALDAATGEVRWCNDTSGVVSPVVDNGVSLQGSLYIEGGELRFLAGGSYETARYDLETGQCLNQPFDSPTSRFHTAFYPYFPEYGKYVSLDCELPDGRALVYDASYEGSRHSRLSLLTPPPEGTERPAIKERSRWNSLMRRGKAPKGIWQDESARMFAGFIVGRELLVAAGEEGAGPNAQPFLAAIDIQDGSNVWREQLPAAAVKGGAAVDHTGRIVVSLEDGQVVCFANASP